MSEHDFVIERLVRNINHEIKNHLTTIVGYAQLLESNKDVPEFISKSRKMILENVGKIDLKLNRLYAVFEIRSESRTRFNLNESIKEAVSLLPDAAAGMVINSVSEKNCEVETDRRLWMRSLELLLGHFDWDMHGNSTCEMSLKAIEGGGVEIYFIYKGIEFASHDKLTFYLPFSDNRSFVDGTELFEIHVMASAANWEFESVMVDDNYGFMITL